MENNNLEKMRHSVSHIMAQAVLQKFPDAKLTIGPSIENGFYYDFDIDINFTPEDLKEIEKNMKHIIKQNQRFTHIEMPIDEAIEFYKKQDNQYKIELIEDLKKQGETSVSFYQNLNDSGEVVFTDLCRGPHLESTGKAGAFKLHKVAGAYWRGDENNKMLQRIYGLAFETKEQLDEYLKKLEEAEKRDHRKLSKEFELYLIDSTVGAGLPMWLPNGAMLWRKIEDFWHDAHLKAGYELVRTPHIGHRKLWETSGHWNFYRDSMYAPMVIDNDEYLLKPMNCPFHVVMYNSKLHSYRELPLRWAESATVYRYEKSGELSGLTRVRGFTQDDAHIVCTKDQVKEELLRVAKFIVYIFKTFGFEDYKIYLSLRDPENKEKYAGNDEGWELTEKVLEEVAQEMEFDYIKETGEAAFYGPKLDFKIKDVLGREWQCSTLQFDFNLPERFDMKYINDQGKEERPYMLHRALFGSYERFIGLLIEHYAGAFPLWLSPEQVRVIPVGESHIEKSKQIADELIQKGIRVTVDADAETVGNKIRQAAGFKVPYMLVIGDKEIESNNLSVRIRGQQDMKQMSMDEFVQMIEQKISNQEIEL